MFIPFYIVNCIICPCHQDSDVCIAFHHPPAKSEKSRLRAFICVLSRFVLPKAPTKVQKINETKCFEAEKNDILAFIVY